MSKYNFWTTRDGRKLRIKSMETNHIENCIKMLKKNDFLSVKEYNLQMKDIRVGLNMSDEGILGDSIVLGLYHDMSKICNKIPNEWIDIFEEELQRRKENV